MKKFFGKLWNNSDFLKLWSGETVSRLGTQVTLFSIPMLAVLTLKASPSQMGYLGTAMFLPHLLTPLFAGSFIDHHKRRPVMIFTNLIRAVLIGSIPVFALIANVTMEYLYVICFLNGVAQVYFELAYHAYIPTLIERADLVEANGKIQTSISAAEVGGPALAGFLVEWITAPFALAVDAFSFLVSALTAWLIQKPEPESALHGSKPNLLQNIKEGFQIVLGSPHLRALAGESATFNLFGIMLQVVFTLYVTRELGLTPTTIGLIFMTGSLGSLAGALFSDRATQKFGFGKAMMGSFVLASAPYLFLLLLGGSSREINILILTVCFTLSGAGISSSQIYIWSVRQAVTPQEKMGRMNAAYRFFVTGITPIGALIGCFLGEAIGLRMTVWVSAVGCLLILPWVIFSPLPTLQKLPERAQSLDNAQPLAVSAD